MRENIASATKRKAKRKNRGWIFVLILLVVAAGGAGWYFYMGPGSVSAKTAKTASGPDYHTTTIKQGSITISASGSGTYTAGSSIDLSFSTRGTVASLKVKAGDTVKAGQELAKLSNTASLEAAVASAQLQVLQNQKALDDLQQNASVSLAQSFQT
jgi:HlyD family secretion protein